MDLLLIPAFIVGTLGIQLLLRTLERRWCDYLIAILMFIPPVYIAWTITEFLWQMFYGPCTMDRIDRVHLYTRHGALMSFVVIGFSYLPIVLLWRLTEQMPLPKWWPYKRQGSAPCLRWTSALLVALLFAVSVYFAQYQTLYDAVRSDNVELARHRLQFNWAGLGPDNGHVIYISSGERYLGSLLPVAIWKGNTDMIDLLLDQGAEINIEKLETPVHDRLNPLSDAMRRRNTEMVDHLLERGIVPTEAIRRVARDNDITMVERMLSAGADPTPAVHSAIEGEHREILELLLDSGADPSPGIAPAYRDDNPELLAHLYARGADPTRALELAEYLDECVLEYLLACGADPAAGLKSTIRLGEPDLLTRLIASGAKPNHLVEYAVEQSSPECLEVLLRHGADPNLGVELALRKEEPESLGKLLKYGAEHKLVRQVLRDHEPRGELFLHPIDRTLDK